MKPEEEQRRTQIQQLVGAGNYSDALAAQITHLVRSAGTLLRKIDCHLDLTGEFTGTPQWEDFFQRAMAIGEEIDRRGYDNSPVELVTAQRIYESVGGFLAIIGAQGPVDGERISKMALAAMDMGSLNLFLPRIDELPEESQREILANRYLSDVDKKRSGGKTRAAAIQEEAATRRQKVLTFASAERKSNPYCTTDALATKYCVAHPKGGERSTILSCIRELEKHGQLPNRASRKTPTVKISV